MKASAYYATALAVLAFPGLAFADARSDYYQRAAAEDTAAFQALDINHDGMLELSEVRGDNNLGPRFDDIDRNRDGVVTQPELALYISDRYGIDVASADKPSMVTQHVAQALPRTQD